MDRSLTDQDLDDDFPEPDAGEDSDPNPPYDLPEDDFLGRWS